MTYSRFAGRMAKYATPVHLLLLICGCHCLQMDWVPRSKESLFSRAFTGDGPGGQRETLLDLQEVKVVNKEWAILTARNSIYVLDLKAIEKGDGDIEYAQVEHWLPENKTTCIRKTADPYKCNNFIRVSAQVRRHFFLMCGTNARQPKCREYQWNGTRFKSGPRDSSVDMNKCPLDNEPSVAYIYTGGNFYSASRMGYRKDPGLRRTPVDFKKPSVDFGFNTLASGSKVVRGEPMPHIATDNNDASVFNDPTFVSAFETAKKVYFFFREVAEEQFGNGEVTISRVAQVCKNDKGGSKSFRSHKWTSYFKARLNCSVPGKKPFQFNELRQLTKPFEINGVTTVFAIMTTPINSIWGSAVCAYSVPAIEEALTGSFMKRSSYDTTSICWSKYGQNAPLHHPANCLADDADTRDLSNEDLEFRKYHPLVKSSVQAITEAPLFVRSQARYIFTAIDAETNVGKDSEGSSITILYIGTSDGHLLKVIPRPFDIDDKYDVNKKRKDGVFIEEVMVYNETRCNGRIQEEMEANEDTSDNEDGVSNAATRVRSVTAVEGRNIVLVAFKNCIIAVPKQRCSNISCRKACTQSGNPYCRWLDGECIPVDGADEDKGDQDLFSENTNLPECNDDPNESATSTTSHFVQVKKCTETSTIAIPLAIAVPVCFLALVILLLVLLRRRGRDCTHCRYCGNKDSTRDHACPKVNRRENSSSSRGPIYTGPRGSSESLTLSGTRNQSNNHGIAAIDSRRQQDMGFGSTDSVDSFQSSGESKASQLAKSGGAHTLGRYESRKSNSTTEDISNLNNNNTKRNIGIAYALTREDTPLRRRSISHQENEGLPTTPSRCIRMGSLSGSTASGSCRSQWRSQQPRIVTNPNFVAVSPMPAQKTSAVRPVERCDDMDVGLDRNNHGLLPKPPVSGLTGNIPPTETRLVAACQNVANARNRTFRNGSSVAEPYYSETPVEPEYENMQKAIGAENDVKDERHAPPPVSITPGRKLSSFSTSHFNSSWFPVGKGPAGHMKVYHQENEKCHARASSSVSGTSSCSSVSAGNNRDEFTARGVSAARSLMQRNNRGKAFEIGKTSHSSDDGYGSGFPSPPISLDFKETMNPYDTVPCEEEVNEYEMPMNFEEFLPISNTVASDDDEKIRTELDSIRWNRESTGKESKKKFPTLKKKKSSKKQKKNYTVRAEGDAFSSPSDDDVFARAGTPRDRFNEHITGGYGYGAAPPCSFGRPQQTLDDSFVDTKWEDTAGAAYENFNTGYAFHTMRPPGRMRQKLPRLRRGDKESDATLIPVPPPEVPKM